MLIAIEGIYENGQITLAEQPPLQKKTKVSVTFFDDEAEPVKKSRRGGSMAGEIQMTPDFNDPLDDLIDYV